MDAHETMRCANGCGGQDPAALDLAHPEVGLKQAFDILENPCWAGPEAIRAAIHKVGEDYQRKRVSRRIKAIKEWRCRISKLAAEGRREAFNYIKQADLPLCDELEQK